MYGKTDLVIKTPSTNGTVKGSYQIVTGQQRNSKHLTTLSRDMAD
jgi:hypothetical protein